MPANSKVDIKNTTEEGKKHAIPLQEMIKENYIKVCKKDITPQCSANFKKFIEIVEEE